MKKEFCTYEQSLALKELGFDELCFGRYYYTESYPMLNPQSEETELVFEFGQYIKQTEATILSPLYQQAFRWFREKYKLEPEIMSDMMGYVSSIVDRNLPLKIRLKPSNLFQTYEEAEQACLDKLIEIVKSK